jgi:hypothetical protein
MWIGISFWLDSGAFAASSRVQVRVEANLKPGFRKPPLGSLLLALCSSGLTIFPSFCVSVNEHSLCKCYLNAIKEIFG